MDATLFNRVTSVAAWNSDILAKRPGGARGRPKLHTGVIASGEKVIADIAARENLGTAHRKLLAIEMEGYGFSRAVWQSFEQTRHLVIRGISDDATHKKNDKWHAYAAAAAASFARHFLMDRPLEPVNRASAAHPSR